MITVRYVFKNRDVFRVMKSGGPEGIRTPYLPDEIGTFSLLMLMVDPRGFEPLTS